VASPPLIGLTAGASPDSPDYYVLRWEYLRSIELAGGIPIVLAPSGPALHPSLIDRLDGVVVTGGPDIEPWVYGQRAEEGLLDVSAERDEFEIGLCHAALERGMPVLGICRGIQLLNVQLGGTLIQDLPACPIRHLDLKRPRQALVHPVRLAPGSRLAGILELTELEVNSMHHQAVDHLGAGLAAAAVAPDGVVEAIEAVERPFVVGVQWHPEGFWRDRDHCSARLFRAFVDAAARHGC
jgi:putative glutamine amidotransferase